MLGVDESWFSAAATSAIVGPLSVAPEECGRKAFVAHVSTYLYLGRFCQGAFPSVGGTPIRMSVMILDGARERRMRSADKMTFTIPVELSAAHASVEGGEYASTNEAIGDAIRVWRRQRAQDAERLAVVRARIRSSLEDPRPNMTLKEVDASLDARFARARAEEQAGA